MPERRSTDRASLGPDYTLRFVIKGHLFQGVRLANLSKGGCFILVPRASVGLFQTGTLLEQVRFQGDGLPEASITGSVAYAFAPNARLAVVGVGVHFVQLPEGVEAALVAFVNARLDA
jgi:c-di-GMP-binding flagellar brake protein YcgR